MKKHFGKFVLATACAIPALTFLSSCDEGLMSALGDPNNINDTIEGIIDIGTGASCAQVPDRVAAAIEEEGKILDQETFVAQLNDPNFTGDFAMAITLNASAINKLFKAATSWNYSLNLGVASVDLQLPTIEIGGCRPSVADPNYTSNFDQCLSFTVPIEGSLIGYGSFSVKAKFGMPVIVEQKQNEDGSNLRSSVFANLPEAQFIELSANGSSVNKTLLQLIETAILKGVDFKRQHLFDIAAWELGKNQVKLLAGAPRVNESAGTLTFGMFSNLQYAIHGSAEWAYTESFPSDAEIGLHVSPDLIRGLLARMMYESQIDTAVAIQNGTSNMNFTVTMADISKEYDEAYLLAKDPDFYNYFTMAFRLWSAENICGYMDLLGGLKIEVSDEKFVIGVGPIYPGKAEGGLALIAAATDVFTSTSFYRGISEYTTYSVNFNEITVPDGDGMRKAQMGSKNIEFKTDGTGMSLFLNFLDL